MSDLTISREHMISINHRRTNAELYKALSEGDDAKVCEMCRELPDGPFHILTIHNDSVLYIASYYKRNNLVLQLISQLSQGQYDKLTSKNEAGNTILHATATNNKTVRAAVEMLRQAPSLLTMTDNLGETALFHAARYGKTKIFNFLEEQVIRKYPTEENLRAFLLKDNTATILHVAIHSENFELAFKIAETYPILIDARDGDGMTALQLLACKPSAFDSGFKDNLFKWLIYKFTPSSLIKGNGRVPIVKQIQKQMLKSESAKKLATLLIETDASWEATETISNHEYNRLHPYIKKPLTEVPREIVIDNSPDSPLFLATKMGCTDIVKKILKEYPQAVEHIDEDGCSILHVAIKYRRLEIFQSVIKMKCPLTRLRGKIDKQGNSILHMVGLKVNKTVGDIRSPALIIREELLLFESVREVCTKLATLQMNNDGKTAEQLFNENNEQLRINAKQWMKSTAEHCTIIAVLIATVAFAAAYTVPGGPDQDTGYPLLKNRPYFIIFALADALSLTFSMTSVITFLSILTSSFRLSDFRNYLHNKLLLGLTMLILSVSFMMVAFAATLVLTISSHRQWTNIILYTISFLPVTMFMFSYVRLYTRLIRTLVASLCNNIALLLPTCDVTVKSTQSNSKPDRSPKL